MTSKQENLYWREWAAVRAVKPETDRHACHVRALGHDKSHLDFSNKDFDAVLSVFRSISEPDNLQAQLRQLDQERQRRIYAIVKTGFSDIYICKVCRDKFGTEAWRDLPEDQLGQLKMTLQNRARAPKKGKQTAEPPPDVPGCPF